MDEDDPPVLGFMRRNLKRQRSKSQSSTQHEQLPPPRLPGKRHVTFLSLPYELRQSIIFSTITDEDLVYLSNSDLLFHAISWCKIHPDIRQDMVAVLGDWIRRRSQLSQFDLISHDLIEDRIEDQRKLLVTELERRHLSPRKSRDISSAFRNEPDAVFLNATVGRTRAKSLASPGRWKKLYWSTEASRSR